MESIIEPEEQGRTKRRDTFLPASILVAAVLIAGSLVYSAGTKGGQNVAPAGGAANGGVTPQDQSGPDRMQPVTAADHIVGDRNAPVVVVEYSDLECPFCKRFHATMQQTVQTYGGTVAWVYRHFPLAQLHSKAPKEAEASECAAELGGNDGFWKYVNRLLELTPSNNGLDPTKLPTIATDVGLDRVQFESCLASGRHAAKVAAQAADAARAGAQGTPYSVVIAKSGKTAVIPGALPFTSTNPNDPLSVQSILRTVLP